MSAKGIWAPSASGLLSANVGRLADGAFGSAFPIWQGVSEGPLFARSRRLESTLLTADGQIDIVAVAVKAPD
jgi:hypothetical protein